MITNTTLHTGYNSKQLISKTTELNSRHYIVRMLLHHLNNLLTTYIVPYMNPLY